LNYVFQALRVNNCHPRILYPAKLIFKINWEIKTFHDKHKPKQCVIIKPAMQKIHEEILYTDEKERWSPSWELRRGNSKMAARAGAENLHF
jgi:hypothetical protein